jgi:hypothetical protein
VVIGIISAINLFSARFVITSSVAHVLCGSKIFMVTLASFTPQCPLSRYSNFLRPRNGCKDGFHDLYQGPHGPPQTSLRGRTIAPLAFAILY